MVQICPHCKHLRKAAEAAPDWQCPACQRAYNKVGQPAQQGLAISPVRIARAPESGGGIGKWLLVAALVGGAYAWFGPGSESAAKTSATGQAARSAAAPQPAVTLYATSWCGYCAATRDFFASNGIEYTELDIETSSAGAEGHRRLNGNGVPLIVVGDTVIRGYSVDELRAQLRPWLKPS